MTGLTVMFFSFTATKSSIHSVADNLLARFRSRSSPRPGVTSCRRARRPFGVLAAVNIASIDRAFETLLDYYQSCLQNMLSSSGL